MGCGSSKATATVEKKETADKKKLDNVQSFHFTDDDQLERGPKMATQNPLGGLYLAQEATDEEKQAAIDRSLQLHETSSGSTAPKAASALDAPGKKHYFPETTPKWEADDPDVKPAGRPQASLFPAVPGARSSQATAFDAPQLKLPAIYGAVQRPNTPFLMEPSKSEPIPAAILALERNLREPSSVPEA